MALNPSNSRNLEQLALKGLISVIIVATNTEWPEEQPVLQKTNENSLHGSLNK